LSTASALSGIPAHSIRQYINRGLIIPFRKESNRNLFSQVDILRLKYIHKLLVEDGLNIAGIKYVFALIPCWAIRNCSAVERENCQAFHNDAFPCWDGSEKGQFCKNSNCRECEVYKIVENYANVKSFLKSLFNNNIFINNQLARS
jgi:MerR family transcriptional regulator/heat shock protein HspR